MNDATNDLSNRDTKQVTVWSCARCGNTHKVLFYHFVGKPFTDSDEKVYEWWGLCPLTGDPILMRTDDSPDTNESIEIEDNIKDTWRLVSDPFEQPLMTDHLFKTQPLRLSITPDTRLTCSDWKALFENNPEMVESLGAAILEWIGFKRRKMDVYTGDGFSRPSEGE